MNVAVIIAGGSGSRMHQDIPKQFINVYDKPVIIYTLEGFQRHPEIDAIEVVCLDGWHDILKAYAKQFNIDKLKWVVSGGNTGQESIRNGVFHLEGICSEDDIVVIHDGIRPLVDDTVLTDVIIKCRQYGNGVTSGSRMKSPPVSTFPEKRCAGWRRPRLTVSGNLTGLIMRPLRRRSAFTVLPMPTP